MKTTPGFLTKNVFLLALLFSIISGIIIFSPIKETFEYHPDEGINAVKASLVLKGFRLYKEIWSDQPPLFTVILAGWFKLFGASFYQGRILVLLFLSLLLGAFFQTIKLRQGPLCAGIASIFLLLSTYFLRLGSSIMLGVPCWALAMTSVLFLTLYDKNKTTCNLLLSALFMALSLQTKFSPAFLVPAVLIELAARAPGKSPDPENSPPKFQPLLLWLATTAILYFVIAALFFYPEFGLFPEQLFKPHAEKLNFPRNDLRVIFMLIMQDVDIVFWALFGLINSRRGNPGIYLPLLWLCLGLTTLSIYRPIWDHYYLFISIPLCWLAAIGITSSIAGSIEIWKNISARSLKKSRLLLLGISAGLIFLTIAAIPLKFIRTKNSLWGETSPEQREVIELLTKQKNKARWIAADMPAYAFYSEIPVPPEIAVATIKRRFSTRPDSDNFINALEKYRPELILLGGFQDYSPLILSYINKNYTVFSRFRFSSRTKGYSSPDILPAISWNHPGQYLPPQLRFTNSSRLNDLIWRDLHIPLLPGRTRQQEFYQIDTRIDIFLRKNIPDRNVPR